MTTDGEQVHALKALAPFIRPHRRRLLVVLACLILLTVCNLAMPKILGYVVKNVFGTKSASAEAQAARSSILLSVLAVILLVYVLRNVLFYLHKVRMTEIGERIAFELRQRLLQHLHTLSVDFYQQNKPGKISARVLQDVQSIKQFIQEELANTIINVLMVVVAVIIMFCMHWPLTLVTLALLPGHVLVYYLFRKPILVYARQAKEGIADVSGSLIEQFDGAATVTASATHLLEQEKFRESMRKSMAAQLKQNRYYILQKVSADLLVGLGLIILFGYGGYSVLHGGMEAADFVAFYLYVGLLYPRVLELVSQAGKFSHAGTSVERVFEILAIEPGVRETGSAVPYEIRHGRIEFRNVSFSYGNGRVLDNVSFLIEPGEHVLVTGPSGSGKSTCVNLIPRFFDPQEGTILIDGVDVRDFTLTSLRRQIGFVFQDCFLFNDTILANIRYAWPQATEEDVIEAARRAYADEFIERLPNAYMTMIGEGGVQLSQGEKRRLMIARVILKDPRVLILDEPLVSLDPLARARAVEGLSSLIGNRTVLSITHFPAELPFANKQIHVSDAHVSVRDVSGGLVNP